MDDTSNLVYLMTMNTIGESVLVAALKDAYYFVMHSDNRMRRCYQESYLFIKGTGLEITIEDYHLDYDASSLRNNFFWKIRHAGS